MKPLQTFMFAFILSFSLTLGCIILFNRMQPAPIPVPQKVPSIGDTVRKKNEKLKEQAEKIVYRYIHTRDTIIQHDTIRQKEIVYVNKEVCDSTVNALYNYSVQKDIIIDTLATALEKAESKVWVFSRLYYETDSALRKQKWKELKAYGKGAVAGYILGKVF